MCTDGPIAQNVCRIAGRVTDAETGEPLPGVNVVIEESTRGAATDADGTYYILNVPPGRYNVRASMVGYETTVVTDVIVNAARTTTVDFVLAIEAIGVEEVIVTAVRPDVERDKTSTSYIDGTFVTPGSESAERSGQIALRAGFHRFVLRSLHEVPDLPIELYWETEHTGKQRIPAEAFRHEQSRVD